MPAPLLAPALLAGCLSTMLEAPYVLVTGLGPVRGVSPSPRTTLLVASEGGLLEVTGEGAVTVLAADGPYDAVATHRARLYGLRAGTLRVAAFPVAGAPAWTDTPWPGAVDLQATCEEALFVADAEGVARWTPGGAVARFGPPLSGVRSLTILVPDPCGGVVAVTEDAVLQVTAEGTTALVAGVDHLRAAALDARGALWVVAGDPPVLGVVGASGIEVRARHLGDTRDLAFGFGGLFPSANAYLGTDAGTLDYARVVVGP